MVNCRQRRSSRHPGFSSSESLLGHFSLFPVCLLPQVPVLNIQIPESIPCALYIGPKATNHKLSDHTWVPVLNAYPLPSCYHLLFVVCLLSARLFMSKEHTSGMVNHKCKCKTSNIFLLGQ